VTGQAAAAAEAAWAARVRANREQVDRVREVPDGRDFYAPVTSLFRVDPRRTDDPVVDALAALALPDDVWLDIGAGAGRYALPLALGVREVVAVDPSPAMLSNLRDLATEHGIANVRALEGRWPPDALLADALGPFPVADVALIAHVGYDVEDIGPFVAAMDAAARRLCVAVLMECQPASLADPFWVRVHGERRAPLPALPEFVELLEQRGARPTVEMIEQRRRHFSSRDELSGFLRRQLWVADGTAADGRFLAALDELVEDTDDGVRIQDQPSLGVGVVTWTHRSQPGDGNREARGGVSAP
jgi:SAM-dependent methyltransferase